MIAEANLPELIASRYRMIRLIATGGMGSVYEVEHVRTGEHLALKMLSGVGLFPEALERFKREARASALIKSENVVRVTDADIAPEFRNAPFLVMELLDGMDLERAASQGQTAPETVVEWLRQVARAIDKAHRLGIVHRDLKPENLFLATVDNRLPIIKILDFGIAKMIEEGTGATGTGQIVGTLKYMAPEQATANALITPATDRYALGLIAYRLLLGESYYQGGAVTILGQLLHGELQAPSERNPRFGTAFDAWFFKACQRNPEQRYASALEQIEALGEALGILRVEVDAMVAATEASSSKSRAEDTGVRRAAPASRRFNEAANVLPTPATPFVGRDQEIAELAKLLMDPTVRLVTILGAGGMGKSRLAIEAGRLLSSRLGAFEVTHSEQEPFHGRVCLVELAPISSAELVVSAIAEAIGLQFYPGGEPKLQLLAYLRGKSLVIVMDNFEHVLQSARLLDDILKSAPGVKVIATSRERLGLSRENVLCLAGLNVPYGSVLERAADFSAIQLFFQSARRVKSDFELTPEALCEVSRICQLVSGMPLGIVLAASWASLLTPKEIGDEIAASFDFLKAELRDMPERQHSLRAVFDQSWKMFGNQERNAFARLSVFRGGFTREAAQAVASADLRTLLMLANKSFISRNSASGRYEIHELLRQYAESQLHEQPEQYDRTVQLHSAYFANFLCEREAGLKGASPEVAAAEIDAELDNVRVAWLYLVKQLQLQPVSEALEALDVFYSMRALFAEAEATFRAAAQAFSVPAPERSSERARAVGLALAFQANHCGSQCHNQEAVDLAGEALDLLDEKHHPRETAFATLTWGVALIWVGKKQSGFDACELALRLYRTTDDRWGTARALHVIGMECRDWAGPAKSETFYRESIAIQHSLGNRAVFMPNSLRGLGYVRIEQGDYPEGVRLLLEALALCEKFGDHWCERICLLHLSHAHKKQGNYTLAEVFARRTIELSRGFCDMIELLTRVILGETLVNQGHLEEAAAHFQLCIGDDARTAAMARRGLGDVAWARGDTSEAKRCYLECLAAFENLGTTWGIAETSNRLAFMACQDGLYPIARDYFKRALARETESWPFVIDCLTGIALLLARTGEPALAAELLGLARQHPATERRTLVSRVEPLLTELAITLPASELAAALERGKVLNIESLANDTLTRLGAD